MVKGKAKLNSRDDLAPSQARSLRSRKRKYPSDETPATDVPTALHQKDKEEDKTEVAALLLQSLLQECAAITNQQDHAEGSFTKEENQAEASNLNFTNVAATGQEGDTFSSPNNNLQQGSGGLHNDAQKSRETKEEITSDKSYVLPNQTPPEQLQVFLPISEDEGESCTAALEKQVDGEESTSLERNQNTSKDQTSVSTDAVKESAVGLPAKKKRRMGMCGLTEKERNQILQGLKHENDLKRAEKAENLIRNGTADLMALEEDTSPPLPSSPLCIGADGISKRSETELKLQSSSCGENERAETEVHFTVTTSDGTSTACDPGCSEGKTSDAEVDSVFGTEITANPESHQLAEKDERLENLDMQEHKRPAAEIMAEMCEKQKNKVEEGSTETHKSSAIICDRSQNDKPNNQNAVEAARPQMTGTTSGEEEKGEVTGSTICDATDTKSQEPNCDSVELCEAAVTPGVPNRTKCDLHEDPAAGRPSVNTEHTQTRSPDDTFGSGCIDYVSDSQLNTIVLNEVVKEKEDDLHPSDSIEDATSLICGLIRELSSLNRRVMAAHREMENMRRSSKSSRSSLR